MRNSVLKIKISEARSKLTQLDKLLKPGEALQINKRDKAYARIELIGEMDGYDRVLNAIESLPETKGKLRAVAQNYKSKMIGSRFGGSKVQRLQPMDTAPNINQNLEYPSYRIG